MVFEGLVSDVLSRVLGEYVKNLNKDQLKIGIFGGNVTLTNLELKEDALANLPINLPVQVKKGFLGRLELKVPWKDLKSKPVIIHIDQIFALAVPQSHSYKYDEKEELEKQQKIKRNKLENYEWIKSLKEAEENEIGTGKEKDTFTNRLVTKIIDNLQIVVNKVHIRFENKNDLGKMYSIGVTLDKISAQSCDERWIPSFIDSSKTQVIRKLAEMHSLGVYIDESTQSFQNLSTSDFVNRFLDIIPDQNTSPILLKKFIVKPISSQLKVTINKNEIIDKAIPKIISDCIFSQITVSLSSLQYRTILHVLQFTNEFLRDIKYLKYRPTTTVHQNPKAWWKYVIQVHLEQIRQKYFKRSWAYLLERRRDRIQYIQLFKRSLPKITWLQPLTKDEQKAIQQLEDKLSFEDIIYFRSLAYAEIKKEAERNKQRKEFLDSKKSERGFFTNLFSTQKKKEDEEKAPIVQLSKDERDELYKTIEYSEVVGSVEEPPDWIKVVANLEMKGFNIQLVDNDQVFMDATYSALLVKFEQRNEGIKLAASIKLFEVYDQYTKKTQFPKIISSIPTKGTGTFASVIVDTRPPDKNQDLFIEMNMDPLNVVAVKPLIFKVVDFFHDPNLDITNISNRAGNHIVNFTERAKVQLQDAIDNHKTLALFVNIHAPVFIIPETVVSNMDNKTNALVVDLGNFKVRSDLTDANIKGKIVGSTANENDFYDKFLVSLESVHVLLTDDLSMVWNDNRLKKDSHIIHKFDIQLKVFSCIQQDNLTLTKLKIQGELNQFDVMLSDKKIKQLLSLAESITNDINAHANKQVLSLPSTGSIPTDTSSTNTPAKAIDVTTQQLTANTEEKTEFQKNLLLNHRNISAQFVIKSINVHLANQQTDLITLSLQDLSVNFVQRTYDMHGSFEMGSLQILDNFTKNSLKKLATSNPFKDLQGHLTSPEFVHHSSESSSMVLMDFKQINSDSPEYQKLDFNVQLNIQNFYFVINPSTIYQLLLLMKTIEGPKVIQQQTPKLISSSTTTRVQGAINTSTNATGTKPVEGSSTGGTRRVVLRTLRFQVPKKKPLSEYIGFRFKVSIKSLGLALNQDDDNLLGLFSINGFQTEVTSYRDTRLVVSGSLSNMILQDFTPQALKSSYKHVIKPSHEQQTMVDFQFKTHPANLVDYQGYESSIQANVRSIIIHANLPFLLTVQDYFLGGTFEPVLNPYFKVPGQSEDIKAQSPQQVSPIAQSPVQQSPGTQSPGQQSPTLTSSNGGQGDSHPITRMKMNIDIETPILVIPQSSTHQNKIQMELGKVLISNSFSDHPKAKSPMDNMKIQIQNTSISIHNEFGVSNFLEKLSLEITLSRTLQQPNVHPDIEDMNMNIVVPKISFLLDEKQYKFYLAMADSLTGQMEETNQHINEIKTLRNNAIKALPSNSLTSNQIQAQAEFDMQYFTENEVIAGMGKVVSRINIKMEHFSFSIINHEEEIAHFTIRDTLVELCNTNSNKTKLQLQMKSILLTDTRKSSKNIFKSILKNSSQQELPFIQLGYIRENTLGDQYINIDISKPNLFLSPTPLFLIAEFFTKPIKDKEMEKKIFDLHDIDDIENQLMDSDDEQTSNDQSGSKFVSASASNPNNNNSSNINIGSRNRSASTASPNQQTKPKRQPSITLNAMVNPTVTLVENESEVTRCLTFKTKLTLNFKRDPRGIENAKISIQNTKIDIYRPISNEVQDQSQVSFSGTNSAGSNSGSGMQGSIDFSKVYESQGSRPIQILKPIELIKIIYTKSNLTGSETEWNQDIQIDCSALKLFFSYDDITTISNIANHILEQQKHISQRLDQSLSAHNASQTTSTLNRSTSSAGTSTDFSASSSSMAQLPSLKEDILYGQNEKLTFKCPTLSILFINESPEIYLPLAEIFLSDIDASGCNWSTDLQLKTVITLKADYFNEINMKFEPLIEDWEFRVDLKKYYPSGKIRGSFMATKDVLNINVSYGLIQSLYSTIQLINMIDKNNEKANNRKGTVKTNQLITPSILTKHLVGFTDEHLDDNKYTTTTSTNNNNSSGSNSSMMSSMSSKQQFHSHWISNETGLELEYSLPKYETPFYKLDSGSQLVPVPVKLSKSRDSTIGDHLQLTLKINNFTVNNISLDSVGFIIYQLQSTSSTNVKGNQENVTTSNPPVNVGTVQTLINEVLCEVRLRPDGSKIVILKSLYQFENNTNHSLSVKFDNNTTMDIQKNTRFSLPLMMSNSFKQFSFRLQDSGLWSETVEMSSLMTVDSKLFKLLDTSSQNKASFISLVCQKHDYHSTGKNYYSIQFYPPIQIENLLPHPFNISLNGAEKIRLNCGDLIDIYCYAPGNPLTAVISDLEGFPETKHNIISGDSSSPNIAKQFKLTNSCRDLVLDIEKTENIRGIRLLSFYCQYWLVNNTLLPLQVKLGDHDSLTIPINEMDQEPHLPVLFSSSSMKIKVSTHSKDEPQAPNEKMKKRYSPSFPIITVGNANPVLVPNPGNGVYEFSYKVEFCKNSKFGLSKIVTFSPRHVIHNTLTYPVLVSQFLDQKDKHDKDSKEANNNNNNNPGLGGGCLSIITKHHHNSGCQVVGEMRLEPGEFKPYHWPSNKTQDTKICIQPLPPGNEKYRHSGGFFIDSASDYAVKCRSEDNNIRLLYHINIQDQNGTLYVTIPNVKDESAPYLVQNDTQFILKYYQKDHEQLIDTIPSGGKQNFGWDDPSGDYIIHATINDKPIKKRININKIKGYQCVIDKLITIYITISIEGCSRLIQFSTNERRYKKLKKLEDNSLSQSQDTSEYHLFIRMKGIGISIIDQTPLELAYISMKELFIQMTQSHVENTLEIKLAEFQIDNQLVKTEFPVILASVHDEKTQGKDFLHLSLVKSTVNNIDYFRYFSVLVQELNVQFEDHWLKVLLDFFSTLPDFTNSAPTSTINTAGSSSSSSSSSRSSPSLQYYQFEPKKLYSSVDIKPKSLDSSSMKMLYFVLMVLNPIKLNLTLALQNDGLFQTNHKILSSIEGLGLSLTKLDRAPITLNGLIMEHPFSSRNTFIEKIKSSYISQILRQFYIILGSIDAIGNPAGLFRNFGTGVHDFFVEPAQGIVKSPAEFGKGLAKGTSSLVKNSIYGTFNTLSKITSTIGTGVANLSFDDQYLHERKIQQSRKPKHIGEGLAMGGVGLGRGLLQGITGIVTKPVEGAKKGGLAGLAKGLVQGVVGVAVKPATAVIDLTTKATEGIKNTTNLQVDVDRVRPPRYFPSDGVLCTFNHPESEGWFLLKTSHKGKHAHENYIWHQVINPDQTVIISDQSIILIKNKKNLLHSTFIYNVLYSVIKQVTLVPSKGICLDFDPPQTLSLLERDQKRTTIGVTNPNVNELLYVKLSHSIELFKKTHLSPKLPIKK
ncbi:vacuolar protein sorting-associated protein 13 family protein [Tieghemostelium lacteum]|uniref:Vacuolar protein sorting-associated protein 13 family protein n=1 Tax=Tieghemostelium lacteum TaxID=361077 RepID=A0A152A7B1_TIELA|nr:vacuolar protein sorting-associated protein 13 family protein [Tieghemostelium lacteum]|eukprot:KYR02132.1 vacuolar protein sorting-associated protein 13 family protein [Tieghemostelium lacteum]